LTVNLIPNISLVSCPYFFYDPNQAYFFRIISKRVGDLSRRSSLFRNGSVDRLETFDSDQIRIVNNAVFLAEELVSNHYKISGSEWLRQKYDIRTLADLTPHETVFGPFAQIIRYVGKRKDTSLGSSAYDFYKICLQDHSILSAMKSFSGLKLFPFILYIVTHELIHIVRFSKFLQSFEATASEKMMEETRVHQQTHEILNRVQVPGILTTLQFYARWHEAIEAFEG